jgi:hypothetical protein
MNPVILSRRNHSCSIGGGVEQLLQGTIAYSFRIRYVSLSTLLFRCFSTLIDDPCQLVVGQVVSLDALPKVVGLGACLQSGSF